jgi:hypothetical protein
MNKHLFRMGMFCLGVALLISTCALDANAACQLNPASGIKNVVYIEFDNVHFTRDNPNVPSDMEQMPNLLNFLEQNGTLDSADHAVLISHTANDILTTQIGVYSDRDGIAVANSLGVFSPITQANPLGVSNVSSFFYWTDLIKDITPATADSNFALVTETGENMPAPWVPFTRAGCDVGAFSTANIVLERTPFDVIKVFGANSPQAAESSAQQTTDFVGEAIHCATGSALCTTANGAVADLLPSEPGGYTNFNALIGGKYVNTAFGAPLKDLDGNVIADSKGNPGFPGFSPTASQTLGAVATMLEHGVHIVFAYIADLHDNQSGPGAFGPGQAGYVAQAAAYNKAFGQFFSRLKNDGITPANTLFVITPDEGDHFVGGTASPSGCDGVKTPCTYAQGVGEEQINLNQLTANAGNNTQYSIHFDDAPTVYIQGQPGPTDPVTRQLEKTMAGLKAVSLYTNQSENLMAAMADPIEEKMLHMVGFDPARTPTFTFFGNPNYFFQSVGPATPVQGTGFAWNHGDIQPEIARTFIGIVGPGVANLGLVGPTATLAPPAKQKGIPTNFFSDHVDVRPTIMYLAGLKDDYEHDGRVLTEFLTKGAQNKALKGTSGKNLVALGQAYKQINAPFGPLAAATLTVSTKALTSSSAGDTTYLTLENQIEEWTEQRDSIAEPMETIIEDAEFNNQPVKAADAKALIKRAQSLLAEAQAAAQ